jgi:hypothetical protein
MKIQVIGAAGTGKSTLCKYISETTGAYWIDTDRYLWKDNDFAEKRPVEERLKMYNHDTSNHQDYIVSGSIHTWNPGGFNNRELLVLLMLDEEIRMERLYARELSRFGTRMLPGGDHYQLTCEFLDWCRTYLTADEHAINSLACHALRLSEASCETLILDGNQPIESLCACILNKVTK